MTSISRLATCRSRVATPSSSDDQSALLQTEHFHLGYFEGRPVDLGAAQRHHLDVLFRDQTLAASDRVVDVGCGLGNTARWVRERYGSDVVAIDISDAALRRSRARDDLPLAESDMAKLPLRSGSIDLIVGVESVYGVPRRDVVFVEFARILRPGGTMLLSDYLVGDNPRPLATRLVSTIAYTTSLEPEAVYRAQLHDAGFVDIAVVDVGHLTAVATAKFLQQHPGLRHELARVHLGKVRGTLFSIIAYPLGYKFWCRAFRQGHTRHVFLSARRAA